MAKMRIGTAVVAAVVSFVICRAVNSVAPICGKYDCVAGKPCGSGGGDENVSDQGCTYQASCSYCNGTGARKVCINGSHLRCYQAGTAVNCGISQPGNCQSTGFWSSTYQCTSSGSASGTCSVTQCTSTD
jgi:hypothetical protein